MLGKQRGAVGEFFDVSCMLLPCLTEGAVSVSYLCKGEIYNFSSFLKLDVLEKQTKMDSLQIVT